MPKFQKYLLLVMITIAVILTAAIYSIQQQIILPRFAKLEGQKAESDIKQVIDTIKSENEHIAKLASDWSVWDDTYQFAQDANRAYIKSNLAWVTLEKDSDINLLYIFNKAGELVWGEVYASDLGGKLILNDLSAELIKRKLPQQNLNDNTATGLINTSQGLMILTSHPILTSEGTGPNQGVLLMGRFFNTALISKIKTQTQVDFDISLIDKATSGNAEQLKENSYKVKIIDDNNLDITGGLYNLSQDLFVIIKASIPRDIMQQGVKSAWLTSITVLICLAGTSFILFWGISRYYASVIRERNKYITELVELRTQDLKQAKDLAEQAELKSEASNRAKSQFLTNMSHEIRTPINAIMGLTHLTLKTDLNSKQDAYLRKTLTASNTLLSLINDILDFSKIEAGKIELEAIDFSVQEIFTEVDALLAFKAQEKGVSFTFDIIGEENIYANGDQLRLKQVLLNLANNAIKFTPAGSIKIQAKDISPASEASQILDLEFTISDTGIGLSANEMENLFVEFSQADTSTTRKYGGSGLGLAISKKLIEFMQGEISVSSEKGVGSCFSFNCQFNKPKQISAPATDLSPDCSTARVINATSIKQILTNRKFLVVEDNEINQEIISEILESEGIEVYIANNGIEAVKYFEDGKNSQQFDIVLMDIQMPEMDGYQATRLIRQHISLEMLPIIAMSAHTQDENINQCIAIGMNDYIMKPYEPKIMFATIRNNLIPF